jgi:PAS domain-containing protein
VKVCVSAACSFRRLVNLHKGGGVIWAEVGLSLVHDPDGKPRLAVGTMRDLTAQRRAEAEVRELNAELEARVEQRTAELTRANQDLEVSASGPGRLGLALGF